MTVHPLRNGKAPFRVLPQLYPEGIVCNRFRIVETIGFGGSATVFEAEDLTNGQMVALKAIPAEERLRKRARREMRAVSSLNHAAIVRLIDSIEDEDYIYVAFELVRGNDLAIVLKERRLEESEILRAVAAVCDALEHAHANHVIHRDVKPGNILLRDDGILKLTDFGIAQIDQPDATVDESLLGTLSYMAPEQVRGEMQTGAVDVWAAALVAYEALTRTNPYRSKNPVELTERHRSLQLSLRTERPDLPSITTKMIDRALDLDYQRRPLPAQLRDALLRGASALERGDADGEGSREIPDHDFHIRMRDRWLRAVPDPQEEEAFEEEAEPEAAAEEQQPTGSTRPRQSPKRLARIPWTAGLTGAGAALTLSALPFYPTGWPIAIGVVLAVVALRLPLLAGGLVLLASLPLLGNLAFGLVPGAALLMVAWIALLARDGKRVLLPVLAPILTVCFTWALYPLLAGTARRSHARAALGAVGGIVMTVAVGLVGTGSPLIPMPSLRGLGTTIQSSDDAISTAAAVGSAIGYPPLVVALIWAAMAVTAPRLLAAHGRGLLIATMLWLGLGSLGTAAAAVLAGTTVVAPAAILVGAGVAGIVIVVRSRLPTASQRQPGMPPERPTRG